MKCSKQLNLLIVDDNAVIRMSFRNLLNTILNLNVIGECADGSEVIPFLKLNKVDVIFMDVVMKNIGGFKATKYVKKYDINIKVIGFSSASSNAIAQEMIASGADSFISKFDITKQAIITEIDKVMNL